VLPYFDMPVQHAASPVLKRMGRHTTEEELRKLVEKLRREIPEACLRTTLIVGFPGETEDDFKTLKKFVREMRFDRLGVFAYSREENTPAYNMDGQIDEELKLVRKEEIMELQKSLTEEVSQGFVGKQLEVLVEGNVPREEGDEEGVYNYVARSFRDAPDIDGFVFFSSRETYNSGDYLKVEITGAYGYDMLAKPMEEE